MPNLPKHIELAKLSSNKIYSHNISNNIGYFLLGSTAPDMHVITKENREKYHFSTLSVKKIGTSLDNIFSKCTIFYSTGGRKRKGHIQRNNSVDTGNQARSLPASCVAPRG